MCRIKYLKLKVDSQPTRRETLNQIRHALPLDAQLGREDVVPDGKRCWDDADVGGMKEGRKR